MRGGRLPFGASVTDTEGGAADRTDLELLRLCSRTRHLLNRAESELDRGSRVSSRSQSQDRALAESDELCLDCGEVAFSSRIDSGLR